MAVKPQEHCSNGFSPSSSSRWTECSGSANLSKGMPNKTNPVTDLGSYFHELSAYKVNRALKRRCEKPTSVLNNEESDEFTDEYESLVMKIVKREMRRDANTKVLVEERVSIDDYIAGTFGTCDLAIISKGKLYVIDAKFGFKEVSPFMNKQLFIYALGLLSKYGEAYGIEKVVLGIYQPRIQRCIQAYQTTSKKIIKWGNQVLKVVGMEILEGKGKFKVGDYCGYCPALSHCKKHLEEFVNMQNLVEKDANKLTDDELVQVLEKADSVISFIESVKEYALSQMMEGKEIPNFKIVEGRSINKFIDEEKVVSECSKAGYQDIFKKSLISVAEMKKLMGKDEFNKILGSLVTRPQGKATLAKITDKNQRWTYQLHNKNLTKMILILLKISLTELVELQLAIQKIKIITMFIIVILVIKICVIAMKQLDF